MSLSALGRWLRAALAAACVGTTAAQAIGLAVLSSQGALRREKIAAYAAVIYGFDLRDLAGQGHAPPHTAAHPPTTPRDAIVARRTGKDTLLADRLKALKSESSEIHNRLRQLKENRERYDLVEKSFLDLLDQLERDAGTAALQEVQSTLEVLQPKQAKDVILAMLHDEKADSTDDVLGDVVAIIKSMPQEKLKKIFGEFKSDSEQQTLHRILVQIGELASRQQWESNR
mgnify:CR=1 FL=1